MTTSPILLIFTLFMGVGCTCNDTRTASGSLNEMGMFRPMPVHYELRVEKNAATVTINDRQTIVVCDTFSEGCAVGDLGDTPPRLRHYDGKVDLVPFLREGSNHIKVERRRDGEEEDPVKYSLVRVSKAEPDRTLAQSVIPKARDEGSFTVEVPSGCEHPPLPGVGWVAKFLDVHPEAAITLTAESYEELWPPARSEAENDRRAEFFEKARAFSFHEYPFPADAIRQTHRSAPLTLNYSCENERLFVHSTDGGYLFAAVKIERHPDSVLKGADINMILSTGIALGYVNDRWYYADSI